MHRVILHKNAVLFINPSNTLIMYHPEAAMGVKKWSEAMMNVMEIDGVKAVIAFDPEINMFRGEFVGLNGGADVIRHADDVLAH